MMDDWSSEETDDPHYADRPIAASNNFCCLHLIEECKPISVMLRFKYALDLEVVTIAQVCRSLSINNDAAATGGTSQ